MRSARSVLIVAALAIATPAAAGDGGAFGERVVPILNQRCVMCHVEGGALGELSLYPDPWSRLVGVASTQSPLKLVEAGVTRKKLSVRQAAGNAR